MLDTAATTHAQVLPCSKRFCHDWVTCPFAHPAEKAKRRDPRAYTYTGVACPDQKKVRSKAQPIDEGRDSSHASLTHPFSWRAECHLPTRRRLHVCSQREL